MSTFIRNHIVEKIKSEVKLKQTFLGVSGFLYFDKQIKNGNKTLNRINDINIFVKEEVLPTEWWSLTPQSLLQVYSELKDNNFYIYKTIKGKSHKLRVKKR